MTIRPKTEFSQTKNHDQILCPNETQMDIPYPAAMLRDKFGLLPYQAKIIAEMQGFVGGEK